MGFLAPLYALGLLAISLPILFHLIRRNPRGRQEFSSLMFLTPSPPRLTKRSRLSNILLLILRALAFLLLAFAFARPFIQQGPDLDTSKSSGRRIAILVDTSASMQRTDLWNQAREQVDKEIADLTAADAVALYAFDRNTRPVLSFDQWNEADPASRVALLKSRMAELKPTFFPTRLGDALATVAGQLGEHDKTIANDKMLRQIVLISDMQQGSHPDSLQGHEWPKDVVLEVRPVTAKQGSNASIQWVNQKVDDSGGKPDTRLLVCVTNEAGSNKEQFTLHWANDKGIIGPPALTTSAATLPAATTSAVATVSPLDPIKVYVAPGRTEFIRIAWPDPSAGADRLVLTGDDSDFDNTLYLVPPRAESLRVVYLGDDAATDTEGLRYYLQQALADTVRRHVEIIARHSNEALTDADLSGTRLVVVTAAPSDDAIAKLRQFMEGTGSNSGGDVLWVLKDTSSATALARLMGVTALDVKEAPATPGRGATGSFSLLGRIDFTHPLFAPFALVPYNDFTMIHFWKHRSVQFPPPPNGPAIIASFDNGDPFLAEQLIGKGRLRVMTSGWQPADSELIRHSAKFIPLLEGLVQRTDRVQVEAQYTLGDPIALPPAAAGSTRTLVAPDGHKIDIPPAASTYEAAEVAGVYKLQMNSQEAELALNLSPDESRTAPLATDDLERFGAKMGIGAAALAEAAAQQRQLKIAELENHQKLWRWMIVGVLGLLVVETAVAGRQARRAAAEQGVA